jgi:hypothetical protein
MGSTWTPVQWCLGSFPGVQRQGHDVDLSAAYRAKVKNEWNYNSAPPHVYMACTVTTFTIYVLYIHVYLCLCVYENHRLLYYIIIYTTVKCVSN